VVDVRSEPPQQPDAHAATAAASASAAAASSSSAAALAAGSGSAPRCLTGHEGEVNCVSWDPTGTLLLSGSDDGTAKIWSAATGDIVHDLVDHAREVLVARWSGTGACTDYHKYPLFVATGSVDTTVKLWDPTSGSCLHTLSQHTHPVSQVAFAPRQQLLATASHERIFLWSLTTGTLLRTFKNLGDPDCQTPNHVPLGMLGGLNALAFDNKGEQLAVSYADGMTYVIDLSNKQAWEEHARNAH
jgi:transducin (beta)-like 1